MSSFSYAWSIAGRRAIVPGALTVGAVCTVLQYGFNELSVSRLRYIARLEEENKTVVEKPSVGTLRETQDDIPAPPAFQSLMKMIGFIPVSEEEALNKMTKTRDAYLKRIAELEREIDEDKALKLKLKEEA